MEMEQYMLQNFCFGGHKPESPTRIEEPKERVTQSFKKSSAKFQKKKKAVFEKFIASLEGFKDDETVIRKH